MKKTIDIPDGVTVEKQDGSILVKGPKGELKKSVRGVKLDIGEKTVTVTSITERRKDKAMSGTWGAHINNMITGVTVGWEARLKMVYSHFPVKFNVDGTRIVIQNFMGERNERVTRIKGDVKVEARKDDIIVTGINKEEVGQTAANIELICKVKGYDRRVFQDGCHLVQKCHPIEEKDSDKSERKEGGGKE